MLLQNIKQQFMLFALNLNQVQISLCLNKNITENILNRLSLEQVNTLLKDKIV